MTAPRRSEDDSRDGAEDLKSERARRAVVRKDWKAGRFWALAELQYLKLSVLYLEFRKWLLERYMSARVFFARSDTVIFWLQYRLQRLQRRVLGLQFGFVHADEEASYFGVRPLEGQINLRSFPHRCDNFYRRVRVETGVDTLELEAEGKALLQSGETEGEKVDDFLDKILRWRDRAEVRDRKFPDAKSELAERFPDVSERLRADDFAGAVRALFRAPPTAGVACSTLLLRMLAPERACVYDTVMSRLMYFPHEEVMDLYNDCAEVAAALRARGIDNDVREDGKWLIADVGGVIYNALAHDREKIRTRA